MSEHLLTRRGVRLAYERRGNGPLVVLAQGLGLPGSMWLQLPGGLVKSGYTVVTPDARGTGRSDAPLPPYTMRQLAEDLAAVILEVGQGPALVVGLSFGGMVAQHLALRHPDLVSGLVLAATSCGLPHGKLPNLSFLALLPRSFRGDPKAVRAIRELLVHPRTLADNPALFEAWDRQITKVPVRWQGLGGQLAAAALHSTGFFLGRIRCPTVVVAGDADRIVPPDNARILAARIPGARLMLLPGAGHAFPLEQPGALPRAIRSVQQRG